MKSKNRIGNIFASHTSYKGLVFRIYKELLQISNKNTNNPIERRAKDMSRYFFHEEYKWPVST